MHHKLGKWKWFEKNHVRYDVSTDLDIVDSAIHGVVCQKSDFHGNSDIQNSKKLDPLENKSKKNSDQNKLAF